MLDYYSLYLLLFVSYYLQFTFRAYMRSYLSAIKVTYKTGDSFIVCCVQWMCASGVKDFALRGKWLVVLSLCMAEYWWGTKFRGVVESSIHEFHNERTSTKQNWSTEGCSKIKRSADITILWMLDKKNVKFPNS